MEQQRTNGGEPLFGVLRRAALALVAASAVGWLGSGSCQASYCSEDCDPCLKQCRCSTSVCYQSNATFQATHTLGAFELVEESLDGEADDGNSDSGLRRAFRAIEGLSVQRAGGPTVPDARDCVLFAQGVIATQPATFAPRSGADGGAWALDAVVVCEDAWVVQFRRTTADRRVVDSDRESLTFLFDARGNLLEIEQVASR